jgi:hypothetical protein
MIKNMNLKSIFVQNFLMKIYALNQKKLMEI